MSLPLPLPVRVLVKGPSTPIWTSWMGGPPSDLATARAVEAELLARGRHAEVRCAAHLGEPTKDLVKGFNSDIVQWSPDVIVISAGHIEAIHLFLPRWFERWANRVDRRPGRWRHFYRRKIARSIWKGAGLVQARVDRHVSTRLRTRRVRRAMVDLQGYLDLVAMVGSPRILLLEILPPVAHMLDWFPGMAERVDYVNGRMREIARDSSDAVSLVGVRGLAHVVAGDDPRSAIPDGIHFTPQMHRAVARSIADDVETWAAAQPHLEAP